MAKEGVLGWKEHNFVHFSSSDKETRDKIKNYGLMSMPYLVPYKTLDLCSKLNTLALHTFNVKHEI